MKPLLHNLKTVFISFGIILFSSASLFSVNRDQKKIADSINSTTTFERKAFIENKGQLFDQNRKPNPACLFLYASDSMNLQLRKTGFSYDVYAITDTSEQVLGEKKHPSDFIFKFHRIDVEILGINPNVEIVAMNPEKEFFNYYNITNPVKKVKQYAKVLYRDAYKDIDIEFFAEKSGLIKYNFVIHPGGKIEDIQLKFDGGDKNFFTNLKNDKIEIQTSLGKLNESIPESWVEEETVKQVSVSYRLLGENTFGFKINEPYSVGSMLVIDPLTNRSWATYYGGAQHDGSIYGSRFVHDLTLDATGNIYFTASTSSTNQIATTGAFQGSLNSGYDAVAVKFNCDGTLAWGTYYGGPGSDYGHNLATDGSFLYVAGTTNSSSDIATPGCYQSVNAGGVEDLFLIKFDFNGNRIWGTYYGGLNWDYGADIGISPAGEIYISGGTNSTDGIATPGSHQTTFGGVWDAFVAKFTSAGTRVWGTYYGGSPTEAWWSSRIATDNVGNVYLSADVWGNNPAIASVGAHQTAYGGGSSDAFLVKFNSSGTRLWGTYYGGAGNETFGTYEPFGIKTDALKNVYFFGTTGSSDNISTIGCYQQALQGGNDVFLAKFDSTGTRIWGTYYGGTGDESGYGITLDLAGGIYVSGLTASTSGIATPGAYSATYNGGTSDGFFSKFSNSGILQSGSYYGGSGTDRVNCIVTDGVTQLYLFGETDSPSNISTSGSFQPTFGGGTSDAFLVKFLDIDNIQIIGPDSVCKDSSYIFTTALAGSTGVTYNWIFPAGTIITSGQGTNTANVTWGPSYGSIIIQVSYPGLCTSINDTLDVITSCTCLSGLTLTANQTNDPCIGGSNGTATVNVTGGASPFSCIWSPAPGGGQFTQTVTGLNAGVYGIKVTDANGCYDSTSITIIAFPSVIVTACSDIAICAGSSANLTASGTLNYSWSPATGLNTTTGAAVTSASSVPITYYVTGTDANNCSNTDSVKISINPSPLVSFTAQAVCLGDTTAFNNSSTIASGTFSSHWIMGYSGDTAISTHTNYFYPLCNYYLVTLSVTSDSGCISTNTDTAFVDCKPTAAFAVNNVCDNQPAVFTNTTTGAASYSWDFDYNTGADNVSQSPSHLYASGNYNIQLIAGSAYGCFDTAFQSLIVYPKPVASFVLNSVCLGTNTLFSGSSVITSDTILNWAWNFGDSSPYATTQNSIHTYANAGSFNASLIITTNNGCSDTLTQITVVHPLPVIVFDAENACDGSAVSFNDLSIIPATDTIQSWLWNFGDNSSVSNIQNATHVYPTIGIYAVQLLVITNFGCLDSASNSVTVNPLPVVNYTVNDTLGCEPLCVSFQNTSTIIPGSNASWLWNFGDGFSASDPNHCYNNDSVFLANYFNVSLTVTSDSGCVKTLTKNNYITVYPNPVAFFLAQPQTTTISYPIISITNLSTGGNFWNWDFGDSETSSSFNSSSHSYADTGAYIIRLITSNQYNCIDTAYQTIIIEPDFEFYIPNSFSPNADGVNDFFTGKGVFIKEFEMNIFDRWGNRIYNTTDINKPWDGKANRGDEIAEEDVYVYSIKVTDFKRGKHNYKGIVTLVR